jgi:hypothetical protein
MKKLLLVFMFIVVLHQLKTLQGRPVQEAGDGATVSTEHVDEIKKLTRVLKHQYNEHCKLCRTGKNPKFMRQTPGEFEYRFNRSRDNIEKTIQKISAAYTRLGVSAEKIAEQEKQLRDGIYTWM